MRYWQLEPEIAGELGEGTVMDTSVHPQIVSMLVYEFSGWLGDCLLESFPAFIITQEAAGEPSEWGATGAVFDEVKIVLGDVFQELYPDRSLPSFFWLKPTGTAGKDDFGLSEGHELVVSDGALDILKGCTLNHCDIEPNG